MKSLFNITNKKLKMLFTVLFFGGMWGLVEATLGTVLHLPFFDNIGVYGSSTAIMLPIAFYLMGLCYKKTNTLRTVAYIGLIAGIIKLSTFMLLALLKKSICLQFISFLNRWLWLAHSPLLARPKFYPQKVFTVSMLALPIYWYSGQTNSGNPHFY